VIAVDDVQDFSVSAQIALFDLYNRVRAGVGALVASGDAAPAQLALREDLRSRLAWGLAFQLHPLSDAEKAAALHAHARARALDLPEDVAAYLLRHARRDMASLIAILDALDRYSLEQKRPVTLPLVRDALESMKDKLYTAS
jgi:DnaA family protein